MNPPVLLQFVQVQAEAQPLHDGLSVSGEAGQADIQVRPHLVDLLEVAGYCLRLYAESAIGRYRHAILALHGYYGTTVVCEDALREEKYIELRVLCHRLTAT